MLGEKQECYLCANNFLSQPLFIITISILSKKLAASVNEPVAVMVQIIGSKIMAHFLASRNKCSRAGVSECDSHGTAGGIMAVPSSDRWNIPVLC